MKQKLLTLLVCSLMAIATTSAGNIASGTFSGGGTWTISDKGELYVDAGTVPEFSGVSYHEPSDEERHIMYVSTGNDARNGIYLTTAPRDNMLQKSKPYVYPHPLQRLVTMLFLV